MGLFSKKPEPKPEPVRKDKVMKMIKLGMAETDAADRYDCEGPQWDRAKAARDAAYRTATQAEMRAAHEALKRHGYAGGAF